MDPTILKVMIHGLIALAPSADPNDSNQITALLLDAQVPLECVGEHQPSLTFRVADIPQNAGQCFKAGCRQTGNECLCTKSLRNKRIRLEISPASTDSTVAASSEDQPAEGEEVNPLANNRGIPSDGIAPAGSPLYFANMTKPPFNEKLNPEYLAAKPKVTNLYARMEIPSGTLTACSLSKREDQGESYVLPMSLKPIGLLGRQTDRSQAFAQMALAKITLQAGQKLTLHISDFGDDSTKRSFILAPGNHGYMIELSNGAGVLERGDPCDDGVARHFAYFYELTEDRPAWRERLIPHVRFAERRMNAVAAEIEECIEDPPFDYHDRPICPMASFIP